MLKRPAGTIALDLNGIEDLGPVDPNLAGDDPPGADVNGSRAVFFKPAGALGDAFSAGPGLNAVNTPPVSSDGSGSTNEDTLLSAQLPTASDANNDQITYSLVTGPSHGAAQVQSNGAYLYSPTANYNGSDSFTFQVSDGKGGSNTYTESISILPRNDAPISSDGNGLTSEDTTLTVALPAATDPEGDPFTYALVAAPSHGKAAVGSDGTLIYVPTANFHGGDTIQFSVTDSHAASNTYTYTIAVSSVNDPPVSSSGSGTTNEDTLLSAHLPASSDVDGDLISYSLVTGPSHGAAQVQSNGAYLYSPDANYNGVDSFTFEVSDVNGGSNTYTESIDVLPRNDAPISTNGSASTNENTILSSDLPGATDPEGDPVTYALGTAPSHGKAAVNGDGSFFYTPKAGYFGADSFTFTVTDSHGAANTYSFGVSVVDQAPVSSNASATIGMNSGLGGALPAATDPEGDSFSYSLGAAAGHGTASVNANGTFSYAPTTNFAGADSFGFVVTDSHGAANSYTYTVTVQPPPTVTSVAYGPNDGALKALDTVDLILNFDRPVFVTGAGPLLNLDSGGVAVYTGGSGSGALTFSYQVAGGENSADLAITAFNLHGASIKDGAGIVATFAGAVANPAGVLVVDTADPVVPAILSVRDDFGPVTGELNDGDSTDDTTPTVTIDLTATDAAVGDQVQLYDGSSPLGAPIVLTASDISALILDIDPGPLVRGTTYAFNATLTDVAGNVSAPSATFTITLDPDAAPGVTGPAILVASDEDAQRTITTAELLANASDPEGDALSLANLHASSGSLTDNGDGTWSFQPAANDDTGVTFTFDVSDGTLTTPDSATLDLLPVNDAPVSASGAGSTNEDTALSSALPAASDVEGDAVTYALGTAAGHGTALVNADGTFTYTPGHDFNGADSFGFTVTDSHGASNSYVYDVTVNPVNDAPVSANGAGSINEDTVLSGAVPAASDVEGDAFTYALGTAAGHGAAVVNADGTFTYTPGHDFNGADSFGFTVTDTHGASNSYTYDVTVNPVNDAPAANTDTASTAQNSAIQIAAATLLLNDTDVDGDTLQVTGVQAGPTAHGTVSFAGGIVTYTPNAGYSGADSFTYFVTDGHVVSPVAGTVNVTVTNNATYTSGGPGDDVINRSAFSNSQLVNGQDGADTITGGSGPDTLNGGNGNDVLKGGPGADTFTGGAGADIFLFTQADFPATPSFEKITDFTGAGNGAAAGDDVIQLSGFTFGASLVHISDVGLNHIYDVVDGAFHGRLVVQYAGNAPLQAGDYVFVNPVPPAAGNLAPNATTDGYSLNEDTALTLPAAAGVLANDSDPNGDPITALLVSGPGHGSLSLAANGSFVYTPNANYNGADSFTYQASDGALQSGTTTVSLTVGAVNDSPTAVIANASYAAVEQTSLVLKGAGLSVGDIDGGSGLETVTLSVGQGVLNAAVGDSGTTILGAGTSSLTISGTVAQINALLATGGTSTLSYVNPSDAPAASTGLSLTIHDNGNTGGGDLAATASSTINIAAVNDPPILGADAASATAGVALAISAASLLANDIDPDGDTLTVTGVQAAPTAHGTVSFAAGVITYTANAGYAGADSFSYFVTDGHAASPVAGTVNVTVGPGAGGGPTYTYGTSGADVIDRSGYSNQQLVNSQDGADTVSGGSAGDTLNGGNGNDVIAGNGGADLLTGGAGSDTLTGGGGLDKFIFTGLADFGPVGQEDVIVDFTHADGDRIVLTAIDANPVAPADQAFAWLGTGSFTSAPGQLRYDVVGTDAMVQGDVNGDGVTDFQFKLPGVTSLQTGDFIL